jgi:hypothetical protein
MTLQTIKFSTHSLKCHMASIRKQVNALLVKNKINENINNYNKN